MTLRVSIEVEEPVVTGKPFRAAVRVETDAPRTTRGVSLLLRGFTTLTARLDAEGERETFGTWSVELAGSGLLEPGAQRFEGTFCLPHDAPPSGDGVMEVFYQLDARVMMEVPWLFDGTATHRLDVVRPMSFTRGAQSPVAVGSEGRGKDALHLEIVLDDTYFAPGERITGAFALGNVGTRRIDAATLRLVPLRPHLVGGGDVSLFASLIGVDEGSPVRFAIPLAPTAACSFPSRLLPIDQGVVLHVDGSSETVAVPVIIDMFSPRRDELPPRPSVGHVRWRIAWREEGSRAGLAIDATGLGLRGTLAGAIEARVRARGNAVQAKLGWDGLGIGLSVTHRGILPGGVALGDLDPAFARRFVARGHDPALVRAALGDDLRRALSAFDEASLEDTGARVISNASAREERELRGVLAALDALARAVVAAERRLPPPTWVPPAAVEAWRAFAAETTGRLCAGRMAILGAAVEGDRADVETRLDDRGRPRATRLTLAVEPPAERAFHLPEGAEADVCRTIRDWGRRPPLRGPPRRHRLRDPRLHARPGNLARPPRSDGEAPAHPARTAQPRPLSLTIATRCAGTRNGLTAVNRTCDARSHEAEAAPRACARAGRPRRRRPPRHRGPGPGRARGRRRARRRHRVLHRRRVPRGVAGGDHRARQAGRRRDGRHQGQRDGGCAARRSGRPNAPAHLHGDRRARVR